MMARKLDAHTKVVQLLLALNRKMNEADTDQDENDDIPPGKFQGAHKCRSSDNVRCGGLTLCRTSSNIFLSTIS